MNLVKYISVAASLFGLNATNKNKIISTFNDAKVKKVIKFGSIIADNFSDFNEKRTLPAAVATLFKITDAVIEELEVLSYDYFDRSEIWAEPFSRNFTYSILSVLSTFPAETIKTHREDVVIKLVTLPEGVIGWLQNESPAEKYTPRLYAEVKNQIALQEAVRALLRKKYYGKPLVMRKNSYSISPGENSDKVVLEVDDSFQPLPSELATQCSSLVRRANSVGVNRSLMLYGPPGTGKSTMARKIVDDLGYQSFRVKVEDVTTLDAHTVSEALDIFLPDAVIFDDFDRASKNEHLDLLEHLNQKIKLVIATVNDTSRFDSALIRPGRFDELIEVTTADVAIVKKILGSENEDLVDLIKDWPLAFISEMRKRLSFMTKEEAIDSIEDLKLRLHKFNKSSPKDIENEFLGVDEDEDECDDDFGEDEDDDLDEDDIDDILERSVRSSS